MDLTHYNPMSPESREEIAERLDDLLANYEVYHQNIRKINWNTELRPFLDLNDKVGFLYQVSKNTRDELAEQIVELGYNPTMDKPQPGYLPAQTKIEAVEIFNGFDDAVMNIVKTSRDLLELTKDLFYLAAQYEEQNTMALMSNLSHQLSMTAIVFSSVRLAQNN